MIYKGETGEIEISGDELLIRRSGVQARLNYGKDLPERRIPLQAVREVRFKDAGRFGNGWLRLVLGADQVDEAFKPKSDDPDAMAFLSKEREAWNQLHEWLQSVVTRNQAEGLDTTAASYDAGTNNSQRAAAKQEARLAETLSKNADKIAVTKAKFLAQGARDDVADAASRMGSTFGGKREIRQVQQLLTDGETVRELATGKYGDKIGIVVLTSDRLLFFAAGLVSQQVEEFPLRNISSIATSGGLLGRLTVHASGNNAVIENLATDRRDAIAKGIRASQGQPQQSAPAAAQPDVLDQLRKLGELRDSGILTAEEFDAKKADLLARM